MNRSQTHPSRPTDPRAAGFTLIELLVVIGIIALLVSILFPTINSVRKAAYGAATSARIQQIAAASLEYQTDFGAYPGPLSNLKVGDSVDTAGIDRYELNNGSEVLAATAVPDATRIAVTGNENTVLGLLGGLKADGNEIVYSDLLVGQGPRSLSPANPKAYEAALGTDLTNAAGNGFFADEGLEGQDVDEVGRSFDSPIPEFLDSYPNPLPLLIYRARPGGRIVVAQGDEGANGGSDLRATFDVNDNSAYTNGRIGIGRAFGHDEVPNALKLVGDTFDADDEAGRISSSLYFLNKDLSRDVDGDGELTLGGSDKLVARQADGMIIVSAGPDRIYGTGDDITNFGPVGQ